MFVSKTSKKNYSAIIALCTAVLSVCFSIFIFYLRFDFKFEAPMKSWVDTATYFNNLLSPIFLLITILLLYLTWKDTKNGLQQQNADNNFHVLMTSSVRYSEDIKNKLNKPLSDTKNISIIECVEALSSNYESIIKTTTDELIIPSEVFELLASCEVNFTVTASYLYQQYCHIEDEKHKKAFKLNLYGTFDRHVFNVMIFFKTIVKLRLENKKFPTCEVNKELQFLKNVALLAHNSNELHDKYFNEKKLLFFCKAFASM